MEADASTGEALAADFRRFVCQTSDSPLGLVVERASGSMVTCADGREFIDLLAGIGVNAVGHAHPRVVEAVREQAGRYLHAMVYGEYVLAPQVELAKLLASCLPEPLSCVYFANSGTEANEGALKLAKKATGRRRLVGFDRSYHGDTHGSLSVTGREVYRRPFYPLLPEVDLLPFGDLASLERIDRSVAGVITEPIQSEGGVRLPPDGWIEALRRRCDETGALLIFDEVQTGMGRTGRFTAGEQWGVTPDVLVLAKALGGGLPLGAFIGSPELMRCLSVDPPLAHVTTFGGHPLSCAAGQAALRVILEEELPERAARLGRAIRERLRESGRRHGGVREVRGLGMLIGVELESAARTAAFAAAAFRRGVLVGWTLHSDTVIRLAPPLNIEEGILERALGALDASLTETS